MGTPAFGPSDKQSLAKSILQREPVAPGPEEAPPPAAAAPGQQGEPGDGSQATGYCTPDLGPFECENCTHFEGPSACTHPAVVADPEVKGQVDPEGCCNLFKSAGNESQAEEHGEGKAGEGGEAPPEPEPGPAEEGELS